ncbi:MAG: 30S ribosomal protein S16 [Deltaproteobacteria bacterium]|nr:30S ribosomal protein S16 [Deltaproteobacteria bacterium]
MSVKIRLSRHGAKKRPYYRIVVADARTPRDGRFLEQVGTYDPRTPEAALKLDQAKVDGWIKQGAQPTQTVRNLIKRAAQEAGAAASES